MRVRSQTPTVTVIIPVYNKQRFIAATIESALHQSYSAFQIIVVDDGSTDDSRAIIERYRDKVTILEHPTHENCGQSAAINLGLKSTTGEYVSILDADDLWDPRKLERQVEFLETHPEFGFVYANGYVIDQGGAIQYPLFCPNHTEPSRPEEMLLHCPLGCPSGYLVRGSLFEAVGYYDEALRSAQDHDMLIRLTEIARVGYIDEMLWFKREHPNSLSATHAKRGWLLGFVILKKACQRYPYSPCVRRRRLAVLHYRLGQCFAREGRYFSSARHLFLAALFDPKRAFRVLIGAEAAS